MEHIRFTDYSDEELDKLIDELYTNVNLGKYYVINREKHRDTWHKYRLTQNKIKEMILEINKGDFAYKTVDDNYFIL